MPEELLLVLNSNNLIDFGNFKLTNLYGFCQTINKCELDDYVCGYRDGINYEHFGVGLLYVLKNDPKFCDECDNEIKNCCCPKKKNYKQKSKYSQNDNSEDDTEYDT